MSPVGRRFTVEVQGLEELRAEDRKVIYHGVNKSGSLAMVNTMFHAYYAARRGNQFFSPYRGVPADQRLLRKLITRSTGHSFFGGHYLYGAVRVNPREHVLTTQFRNPLPRVRSCYQWLANKAQDAGQPFEPFRDWVWATRGVAHSQVLQFGLGYGPEVRDLAQQFTAEQLLERAVENIERDVQWFGIAEYFEESAFVMASICGLPTIPRWGADTRNRDRPLVQHWDEADVDVVREVFAADFALYDWALGVFATRLQSLSFGKDLHAYKRACVDQYKDRLHPDGSPIDGHHPLRVPGGAVIADRRR